MNVRQIFEPLIGLSLLFILYFPIKVSQWHVKIYINYVLFFQNLDLKYILICIHIVIPH